MGHAGREYWSRRPGGRMGAWGRITKWFTHRAERRAAKKEARQELERERLEQIDAD